MDWTKILAGVAPGLAAALGGPLSGGVVKILADKVLGGSSGDPVTDEAKLAGVLAGGITPELRAKIVDADAAFKVEALKAGVRQTEIAADVEKAYVSDTADARKAHAGSNWVMRLAVFINVASYVAICGVLYGCFRILSSTVEVKIDPGIAAMVGGLIGAAVQWLLQNAGQANNFAFGSSPSSRALSEKLGNAVADATSASAGKR